MESQHLLDYTSISLDELTKPTAKVFLAKAQNRAYELRGECDLELLCAFFLRLRTIATEITYRPTSSPVAYLLTTQVDEATTLRPSDVKPVVQFSDGELTSLTQLQTVDVQRDTTIDLNTWWEDAKHKQSKEPAEVFLRMLYTHAQNKQVVHLSGEVPVTLLLLVVNWFTQLATTQVFYNNNRLQ